MVRKTKVIYGFLGPSPVLITYNICPPVIPTVLRIRVRPHVKTPSIRTYTQFVERSAYLQPVGCTKLFTAHG